MCKLEDGFGWDQICPFLGHDIPAQKYPIGNAPAEFQHLVSTVIGPRVTIALAKLAAGVVVPVVSIAAWHYMR